MPIPQKTFFLVERASCPFQNLIKRTFARGLLLTRFYYSDATGNDITFSARQKSVDKLGI